MSFKDNDLHMFAAIGALVLTTGLGAGVRMGTGSGTAHADEAPKIQDLEAIEASLASRKKPAKLPQKKVDAPPDPPDADKVNRDAEKLPDPPKDPKEPPKQKPDDNIKIDPNDPLKNIRRNTEDTGKPTEDVGDFDPNAKGFDAETKGHPYYRGIKGDINAAWEFPKILAATNGAIGCLQFTADGKVAETKLEKSGDSQLDQSVEQALSKVKTKRNAKPEPVPADLLKSVTTRWTCFNFNPQQRSE